MKAIDQLLEIIGSLAFEEDGKLRLDTASWNRSQLRLQFTVEEGNDRVSQWELRFEGVIEHRLSLMYHAGFNVWYDDHVAIEQYTARVQTLGFTTATPDPDRVLGRLWAAHREIADDWIPFDRYFNDAMPLHELLAQPSGLLAPGPKFLIDAYTDALEQSGYTPGNVKRSRAGRVKHACMAHFDESYVIAERIAAKRR